MKKTFPKNLATFYQILHSYRSVIAIVVICTMLTVLTIFFHQKYAAQEFADNIALSAKDEAARVQESVNNIIGIMESIRNFYVASEFVDRNEFHLFVQDQITKNSVLTALEWIPLVQHNDRHLIEKELSAFIPGRRITERNEQGELVLAASRIEYFPVFYVEPLSGNELAVGYDLASNPIRNRALQQSKTTGKIIFSDMIRLIQGNGAVNGILMFQPVYKSPITNNTAKPLEKILQGFALGVIEPRKLISHSIHNFQPTGLDMLLVNNSDKSHPEILHFHPSRTRTEAIAEPILSEFIATSRYQAALNVPGNEWNLYFRPAPVFIEKHRSTQAWVILFVGLVLTSLLVYNFSKRIRYTHNILHQAQHDALTGLPNRKLFQDRLHQALINANNTSAFSAVLYLDLDNFKHINDSLGHAIGDRLLIEVANRLSENTRPEDTIARMGGDEFILLAQHFRQEQDVAQLAKKLLLDLTSPYQIDERTFYLSASIGISLFPRDAMDTEALVANADAAMYRAKSRGRNTYDFYSNELTTTSMTRMQLEVELREAVKNGLLHVHYQPQFSLAGGNLIGAEALARWTHPEQGSISPEYFIALAEDSGLIVEIGDWILHRACQQAKAWLDTDIPLQRMAVNVSGIQLQRSDFVSSVKKVLDDVGLPATHLELELTESVIMAQPEQTIDTLLELSKLGVAIAIDDFGTGHSSLAYLKRLPLDKVKIDRSFVKNLPDDEEDIAITGVILALSKSLGLHVIAEGVETREQRDFLAQLGCDEAQGYYFSRPVSPQDFQQILVNYNKTKEVKEQGL